MIFPNVSSPILPFALLGVLLAFSLLFIFLGRFGYQKENEETYRFRSMFPFEIFPRDNVKAGNAIKGVYLLASIASLGIAYYFVSSFFLSPRGIFVLGLFASILLLGKSVSLGFLLILPAYYHKAHNVLDALSFSLSALSTFVSGYYLFKVNGVLHGVSFVLSIIAMAVGLLILFMMLSPRYKDWVKLDKREDNGSVKVERPRFFLLAASEWAMYALTLLGDVFLYLSLGFLLFNI